MISGSLSRRNDSSSGGGMVETASRYGGYLWIYEIRICGLPTRHELGLGGWKLFSLKTQSLTTKNRELWTWKSPLARSYFYFTDGRHIECLSLIYATNKRHSSGNIDVRNWVHLFESRYTFIHDWSYILCVCICGVLNTLSLSHCLLLYK